MFLVNYTVHERKISERLLRENNFVEISKENFSAIANKDMASKTLCRKDTQKIEMCEQFQI